MKSKWKLVKIGDVGEVVGGGTPSTKNESYYGNEIPWITPKDLSGYSKKYISKGERSITKLGLENSSAKLLPKNTVLLSSRAPIGYVAIASNELTTNQGFKSVVCNEDFVTPDYMYYVLKSSKEKLEAVASGSTFKEVSGKVVKEFEIPLPDLTTQYKITKTLNSLDDKIECNMNIMSTLDELTQTLFKRWFIEYEFPNEEGFPYKSTGGKMIESELGEIPVDWKIYNLEEFTESISKSINKKEVSNARFLNTSNILAGKVEEVKLSPTDKMPGQAKKLIQRGDILYSEIRPKNKRYAFIDFDASEYVVSTKLMVLRVNDEIYSNKLLYQWLTMDETIDKLQQIAEDRSGTFPQITFSILSKFKFAIPEKKKLNELLRIFEPMLDKKQELIRENEKLIELRDSLLPKLLSGEIEIPDESVVG